MVGKANDCGGGVFPPGTTAANGHSGVPILRRGDESLHILLDAYLYAVDVQRSVWDFAVEIETLRQSGWTNSEFRWLVCKGYVLHAIETTPIEAASRSFRHPRKTPGLNFPSKTCFTLNESGFRFALDVLDHRPVAPLDSPSPPARTRVESESSPLRRHPKWDRERQELRVGAVVVKQFKVPAANQERILAAFEEDGWPVRIDDPLPPASEQDPKRRLHDTINSLNRNQKRQLLRFIGDGTGQGIRWEFVSPADAS